MAGDFNGDGFVDAADYTVWRDNLGSLLTPAHYDTWRANFGNTAAGGGAGVAVPEPGFLGMLLVMATVGGAGRFGALNRKRCGGSLPN